VESDGVLSPDGSWLLYKSIPVGAARGASRIMRIPVGGGAPELVAELSDVDEFHCSTVTGASCAVGLNESGRTSFYALDPLKGKARRIGGTDSVVPAWSLSTDGSRIAFIDDAGVHLMRVADGTVERLIAKIPGVPRDVSWSAEGQAVFVDSFVANGWRLVRAALDGRVDVLRQTDGRRLLTNITPSPDGKHLAFGQRTIDSNAWLLENF
jgi:Tol biopolymer transport system component